jgi:hypothetical protein
LCFEVPTFTFLMCVRRYLGVSFVFFNFRVLPPYLPSREESCRSPRLYLNHATSTSQSSYVNGARGGDRIRTSFTRFVLLRTLSQPLTARVLPQIFLIASSWLRVALLVLQIRSSRSLVLLLKQAPGLQKLSDSRAVPVFLSFNGQKLTIKNTTYSNNLFEKPQQFLQYPVGQATVKLLSQETYTLTKK